MSKILFAMLIFPFIGLAQNPDTSASYFIGRDFVQIGSESLQSVVGMFHSPEKFERIDTLKGFVYLYTPNGILVKQAIKIDSVFSFRGQSSCPDAGNRMFGCLVLHYSTQYRHKLVAIKSKGKSIDVSRRYEFITTDKISNNE